MHVDKLAHDERKGGALADILFQISRLLTFPVWLSDIAYFSNIVSLIIAEGLLS